MYTILSISTRSISEIDTKKWKGSTHLKIEKFERFLLALFQPSIHPSRGKALETSPKKNTPFAFERGTYELFSSSNACMLIYAIFSLWEERQNGARHPFPTFNLNIRRVFYLRPWMGQVCSDAEKKEDDTYRWLLIFHGKEC